MQYRIQKEIEAQGVPVLFLMIDRSDVPSQLSSLAKKASGLMSSLFQHLGISLDRFASVW